MNRERTPWLPIGLILTSAAALILGLVALSGFTAGSSGDVVVSSTAGTTNWLLAVGAATLLGLEVSHMRRHQSRSSRPARAAEAIRV
jgi:membrane protein implicated in regulation of membrane protease activity